MPKKWILPFVVAVGACLLMSRPGVASEPDAGPQGPLFVAWELPDKPTKKWFVGPGQVTPSLDDLSRHLLCILLLLFLYLCFLVGVKRIVDELH